MSPNRSAARSRKGSGHIIELARAVIKQEAETLHDLIERIDSGFVDAVNILLRCRGHVVVTGLGKAGIIGQKISASLASLGIPSYSLHPTEALHGDLGCVRRDDVVLALSFSGETDEILRLLVPLQELRLPIVAITGRRSSRLASVATTALVLGDLREAGHLAIAPSTSTTAMLAMGDALALVCSELRGYSRDDFAQNHPGGTLGWYLARVDDVMRPLGQLRVASQDASLRSVLANSGRPGRRSGAILLVDSTGALRGIFTDSDLARLFESHRETALDQSISRVMTAPPLTIATGRPFPEALETMRRRKISELPVVDSQSRPLGLIDITDVVAFLPAGPEDAEGKMTPGPPGDLEPPIIPFPRQGPDRRALP